MRFYVGLHILSHARHFDHCFISINRLRGRKSDFLVNEWILDSGAFTEINNHKGYRFGPELYAEEVNRWSRCGTLLAAVSQDWMCEPFVLNLTGLDIPAHQALTIERYDRIRDGVDPDIHLMPVLQGFAPEDYVRHLRDYGSRLTHGMWVGVGSVCKRNSNPKVIEEVLGAIKAERPDLRLHGFGLKFTALKSPAIRGMLHSSDSMAWSYAARIEGRDANSMEEARAYKAKVEAVIGGPHGPLSLSPEVSR